ncbi:hypothetical protein IWQ61_002296 [Dispira simplex]|nr:hypothetical protein IWQ61_002296 [Dispira simplex]
MSPQVTLVKELLEQIGFPEYVQRFLDMGYDRRVAYHSRHNKEPRSESPVISSSLGLPSTVSSSQDADISDFEDTDGSPTSSEPPRKKRKYCRRPKPDPNAPKHPLNAYVLFCRDLCQRGEKLSRDFGARSKSCSELWRALKPHDQQKYEEASRKQRERYKKAMESYRKTSQYTEYQKYVKTFQETVPNAKPRPGRPGRKREK